MALNLKNQWVQAKKTFETTTGKKKPGPKLLGIFRLPSGLESAFEAIDKAIAAYENCKKPGDLVS